MDAKEIKLSDLEMPIRMWNCFKNEGFQTIGDVLALDEGELLRIPNFGRKSLNEFNDMIGNYSLRVAGKSKRYIGVSVSSDIYEKIKVRALTNNRSVEAETVDLLSAAVGRDSPSMSITERLDVLERLVVTLAQNGGDNGYQG